MKFRPLPRYVLRKLDFRRRFLEQFFEDGLALDQRQRPQIAAILHEDIENHIDQAAGARAPQGGLQGLEIRYSPLGQNGDLAAR
jgi:hypothetical protein